MQSISSKWITLLGFFLEVSVSVSQVKSLPSGIPVQHGDTAERQVLTKVPQNTVAVVGSTVVLECFVDEYNPIDAQFEWKEYVTDPADRLGLTISNNDKILDTTPNHDRYRIVQSTPLDYSLEIRDVRLSDGGHYAIWDDVTRPPLTYLGQAQLIVIEPAPVCTSPMSSPGVVVEGETYTAECAWKFQGYKNYAPNMTWSGPAPFKLIPTSSDNTTVRSKIEFIADRSMEEGVYKIAADFRQFVQPIGDCCWALNIPTWRSIYSLPPIAVNWAPRNVYIEPIKTRYYVGEILTCHAYANPSPFYQWLNTRTLESVSGQTFTITQSMVGYNQTLLCQAQIFIIDKLYSAQVTIEALGAKET